MFSSFTVRSEIAQTYKFIHCRLMTAVNPTFLISTGNTTHGYSPHMHMGTEICCNQKHVWDVDIRRDNHYNRHSLFESQTIRDGGRARCTPTETPFVLWWTSFG
jgi:hypothetical protein